MSNIWLISQDKQHYHDPESFKPERFLGDNPELNPRTFVYGFGRRRCPGIELAEASIYIAISMILAVFEISVMKDTITGQDQIPRHEYISGTVAHPKPFECIIRPRSFESESLIRLMYDEPQLPPSSLSEASLTYAI